jgi:hypothetical protein
MKLKPQINQWYKIVRKHDNQITYAQVLRKTGSVYQVTSYTDGVKYNSSFYFNNHTGFTYTKMNKKDVDNLKIQFL